MLNFKKIGILLLILLITTSIIGVVSAHDPFPPEIKVISPKNNDEISGIVPIKVSIETHTAVDSNGVNFTITGPNSYKKILKDTNPNDGWMIQWDTSKVPNGAYSIKISAKDIDYPIHTDKTFNVNLNNVKSLTKIQLNDIHGVANKKINIMATLKTKANKAISNKNIQFTVNGKKYNRLTDNGGIAKFTFSAPKGSYKLDTKFLGDNIFATSSASSKIIISKSSPYITVSNLVANKNQKIVLKANLLKFNGKSYSNQNIVFFVNNKEIKKVKTNSKGIAIANYKVNLIGGNYTIAAVYNNKTINTATLKVPQSSLFLKISTNKAYPKVGTYSTIYYRIVNKGPDSGKNVLFIYKIPKGFKYISSSGPGIKYYQAEKNLFGWYLKTANIGTHLLKLNVLNKNSGRQLLTPNTFKTDTYDLSISYKKNIYLSIIK